MFRPLIPVWFVYCLRPALEALGVGLCLGFVDSNHAGDGGFTLFGYLLAGAILGFRHAGRALACWPTLGVSLYAAHVVAIACGQRPPYVEENYRFAEQCLVIILPAGISIMGGAGLRVALSTSSEFQRKDGLPIHFFPRTTREGMIAVACLAMGLACIKQAIFPPTIYARGYNESRFQAIRVGMTTEQVVLELGEPLQKHVDSSGSELWHYSDQYHYESNFDRRWLVFDAGKVICVINDYWVD